MRNNNLPYYILVLTIIYLCASGQQLINKRPYPVKKFINPVKIPVSLAGNFGECRPNHFHSGLDIRTNKVENIPIYAIGNGYVSRVKIDKAGFGNAIYVNHSGGYTSLYAHLNKFYPELEHFIRMKQYELKSWELDITFQPQQFPVNSGKFIAYSGNTGSSQAPHLHLEIRDTKTEKPLNGLLFYDYPDTKAPKLVKLAVYNAHKSIYDQQVLQLPIIADGKFYKLAKDTITVNSSAIGLGIVADDPMEGALGVLGVFEADLYIDGKPHFGWQLDNIGYDETRYMNALADYKVKKNGGPWIQLLYKLPGDKLDIYHNFSGSTSNGIINFNSKAAKQVSVVVSDTKGNASTLKFWIKSLLTEDKRASYRFEQGKSNYYIDSFIAFVVPGTHLYDDVPLNIKTTEGALSSYSYKYQVHYNDVPVHDYFELKLKPKVAIPASLASKVVVQRLPYGKETKRKGKAAKLVGGWTSLQVREFGTYELCIDQNPPSISGGPAAKIVGNKIVFRCTDDLTSVARFVATIDNQWIRCQQKGDDFIYEIDERCPVGAHTLVVEASDENGNVSTKQFSFTR